MQKLTSLNRPSATLAPERGPAIAVVTAVAGSLLLILLTGYLTMQLVMSGMGAFMTLDSRAVGISNGWLPYAWRLSLILLALAAVMAHRKILRGTAARIVALATLAAVAFIGTVMTTGPHPAGEQQSLILVIAAEGAKSPLILALIGAGVTDLVARRQPTRAQQPAAVPDN
ncbi:hypothetical protein QWJ39_11930 [Arthrobacter sp. YD4]|uniref:hypothetical protein n=1 Tax=Arthrobacter sp. YD4 TaxID=3058043 RepID=UPI0025B35713|nr:hypothetical protein [Arthrobacter sp. YD4]MDN3937020.1 hypothetical protein [Arthrobacter sp. YD4]